MRSFALRKALLLGGAVAALGIAGIVVAAPSRSNSVDQPVNFKAAALSACRINLEWDQQTANGFEIKYAPRANDLFSNYLTTSTNGNVSSYLLSALSTSTPYLFQVRALDAAGDYSAWSDDARATTLDLPAPPVPPFSSVVGSYGNGRMELSFSYGETVPVTPYSGGFVIEQATSTNGNNFSAYAVLESTLPASRTSYLTAGALDPAFVYKYRVKTMKTSEGCDEGAAAYSAYAGEIVVPTPPSNLKATYVYRPSNPTTVALTWDASKGQNFYEVWRGASASDMAFFTKVPTGASYTDTSVTSNASYFYKVRACTDSGGCSDFSNTESRTIANAPQNLVASVAKLYEGTPGTADALLSWENTFPEFNYYLERSDDGGVTFTQIGGAIRGPKSNEPNVPKTDAGLTRETTYLYRVYAKFGGESKSDYSNVATLNLNIVPLTGFAWAMADSPHGIGWIKFDSNTAPADTVAYGVYRDANDMLSGYAWSGIKCAAGEGRPATGMGSTCGYGWLSFNERSGCPSGGDCAARFDSATNKLSGWAKFTAADPSTGSWDGWVSLNAKGSEPAYAVEYDPATGKFVPGAAGNTSFAWGSNVTGWMSFYDVGMGTPTGSALTEVITNLKATALDCVNGDPNNCPVRLEWTNPKAFSKTQLFRCSGNPTDCCGTEKSALDSCKSGGGSCTDETSKWNTCKGSKFGGVFRDISGNKGLGSQSLKVEGLPEKTTHSFFIEGAY